MVKLLIIGILLLVVSVALNPRVSNMWSIIKSKYSGFQQAQIEPLSCHNFTLASPISLVWPILKNQSFENVSPFNLKDEGGISIRDNSEYSQSSVDWYTVKDSFTHVYSIDDSLHQIKYKIVRCEPERTFCKSSLFGKISLSYL